METETLGTALKALPVKLAAGDSPQTVHLLLNESNELQEVTNPAFLRRWLEAKYPTVEYLSPPSEISLGGVAGEQQRATTVTPELQRNMQFFGEGPCWFDGCDEMREKYHEEMDALENRPGGCRNCDKGALIRKYLAKVAAAQPKP